MAGPNFSSLLKKPAGEAKRPASVPAGNFPGVIKSYELGDANKNKTPYVRVHTVLTGWDETIPEEDREGIDLSKRTFRRDYYLTDDSLFRLDEFLGSLGIELAGRAYEETLPEMVGKEVLAEVGHYINPSTSEVGNQINKLSGTEAG